MEEKHIIALEKKIQFTGFGDVRKADLRANIEEGKDSFQLPFQTKFGRDEVFAKLNFNRSDQGNYFFNSFDLEIKKEDQNQVLKHPFPTQYGNGYTLKEAYNLLDGRSVNKNFIKNLEDSPEKKWAYIDFDSKLENGNHPIRKRNFDFNVEEELKKYPTSSLDQDTIKSIEKGNRQSILLKEDDTSQIIYVEANPKMKQFNVYDNNMNPILMSLKSEVKADKTVAQNTPEVEQNKQQTDHKKSSEKGKRVAKATTKNAAPKKTAAKKRSRSNQMGMGV